VKENRFYLRFHGFTVRWGGPLLFLFALLPVPFDVAGIWAGTARYPLWRFLVYVGMGKVIKVTVVALVGYYSAGWLTSLFH
jgi:membrane protein DedA with SNARE-associated domain